MSRPAVEQEQACVIHLLGAHLLRKHTLGREVHLVQDERHHLLDAHLVSGGWQKLQYGQLDRPYMGLETQWSIAAG